jgi:hypothetical protein
MECLYSGEILFSTYISLLRREEKIAGTPIGVQY